MGLNRFDSEEKKNRHVIIIYEIYNTKKISQNMQTSI